MNKKFLRFIIKKKKNTSDFNSQGDSIGKHFSSVIQYAGLSDKGLRRATNKDSYAIFPEDASAFLEPRGQLFLVADGVGGHIGEKEASQYAVDRIQDLYFSYQASEISKNLADAFKTTNREIYQVLDEKDPLQKIGTTCTALVLTKKNAFIAHVGDTRIYRIRENEIEKLTQDHTEVADKLRTGCLTKEQAKNHPERSVLTRALGAELYVEVDINENISVRSGDRFVLCTDGVGKISSVEIKDIVLSNSPQKACELLVQMANERGGEDNITVLVGYL